MPVSSLELYRDPTKLEQRLRTVDDTVRIVPERHLLRISRMLAEDGEPVSFTAELPLWVNRERRREYDVLAPEKLDGDTPRLQLLVDPNDRLPEEIPDGDLLHDSWRMLVRGAILKLADEQIAAGKWTSTTLEREFARFGPLAEVEIRFVLEAERIVPPDAPLAILMRAFAAYGGDRALFAPNSLARFFPVLPPAPDVLAILSDVLGTNLPSLLPPARPYGASESLRMPTSTVFIDLPAEPLAEDAPELTTRAKRASSRGNAVRAAILLSRAGRGLTGPVSERADSAARSAIHDGLVSRLAKLLHWDYEHAKEWTHALTPLLKLASAGMWPRAARVLFDLQKIVTDGERELFIVDPVECVRTLGRRPLKRSLTRARAVIVLRHLASANYHLDRVRLPAVDREPLHRLIREEMHRVETQIRDELGPVILRVLGEVGLTPSNRVEEIARDKLIAELLDRLCERGYLRLADLRDALSRNQLKLADLSGPGEFFRGDKLLQADARLAEELDGVYRRGEIYLRWIQRLNAAAFGTATGRWLTRFVAIPFGGAFMAVEFGKYLVHEFHKVRNFFVDVAPVPPPAPDDRWFGHNASKPPETNAADDPMDIPEFSEMPEPPPVPPPPQPLTLPEHLDPAHHGTVFDVESLVATFILGCLFLALLHSPAFRAQVLRGLGVIWDGLKFAFVEFPQRIWRSPIVRTLIRHPVVRFVNRYLGTGLATAILTAGVMVVLGYGPNAVGRTSGFVFFIVTLSVNTRFGRVLEDRLAEWWSDSWRTIRVNLIPGFLGWVLWGFRWLVSMVERALYAVDEWLRFREGQSANSLVFKAILAALWFPIAYLVRFGFNLLLEPQINPVKHFPTVTVSHKLLLPLIPSLADATGISLESAALIIGGIPGIFGFIVWELKENWRLYAANRPDALPPAVLGHHGETMRGLLRPGFHSGTVPKLYRWLRHAIRTGEQSGRTTLAGRYEHELEELAVVVEATANRELVPLLRSAKCWESLAIRVEHAHLGVQAVELRFRVDTLSTTPLRIAFEHHQNAIHGQILDRGWIGELSSEQRKVLGVALGELAELCAAKWSDLEANPDLAPHLIPMPWPDRVAFWETHTKQK